MRSGNDPVVLLNNEGRILAIGTGSDACSEHECGSAPLMQALSGAQAVTRSDVAKAMRANGSKKVPDLFERRRIVANLDKIVYGEAQVDGEPNAVIGFTAGMRALDVPMLLGWNELSFRSFGKPKDIAGAWNERGFAFRVRGEKQVRKLREFAAAVKAGQGIFAGTILKNAKGMDISGVCIAVEPPFRPEHRAAMTKANDEFAAGVRLELQSRADELNRMSSALRDTGRCITHIWAVWKGGVADSEVAYNINPGPGVTVNGYQYSYEVVLQWLKGGAKTAI